MGENVESPFFVCVESPDFPLPGVGRSGKINLTRVQNIIVSTINSISTTDRHQRFKTEKETNL